MPIPSQTKGWVAMQPSSESRGTAQVMECGYASTRRAQCTVCAKPIALKALQLGVEVDDPDWGKVTRWSHPACTKLASVVDLQADLQGFDELDPADQETLRSLAKASAPRPKESVSIDRRAIPSLALDSQFSGDALESLKQLGVEIYTEGDLERGIIEQAQDQLAEKGRPQERAASAASTVSAASAATLASVASAEGGGSSSAAAKPAQNSASSGGAELELAPAVPSTQHEGARGSGSGSSSAGSGGVAPRAAAPKRKAPSPSTVDGGAAPAPAAAAAAAATAPAAPATAATVRAPKARRAHECDGDEALARVLSSQRSERVSVARQRVHKPWEGADSNSDGGAEEEGEGEEVKHEVARVVKERQRGGRLEYRVKWSMGDATWEPLEHVEGLEALAEYRARKAAAGGSEHRAGKAASVRPAGDAPRRGGAGSDDEEWHAEEEEYEDEDEVEEEEDDELEEELEDEELEELEEGELEEGELRQPRGGAAAGSSRGEASGGGRWGRGGGKRRRQGTAEVSPYGESDEELEDELLDDGLRMPGRLWKHLFTHQRTCIEWLWELHRQEAGGVVGDEMGLGKTLQVVGIWAALQHSGRAGPCIVVSPATVMRQWVRELRRWAPEIETQLLHNSTGASDPATRAKLVRDVVRTGEGGACAVLVTSYEAVRQHAGLLLQQRWQYVVLDEGHKIRNPDAAITQVCKRFNTGHRLILTGSPIQNKLTELWSLFDFVFPGKLGTLPTFHEQFGLPIAAGTYANASRFKVQAAYQCSLVLRSLIRPHLLRRLKADVDIELPDKTEQVRRPDEREA